MTKPGKVQEKATGSKTAETIEKTEEEIMRLVMEGKNNEESALEEKGIEVDPLEELIVQEENDDKPSEKKQMKLV